MSNWLHIDCIARGEFLKNKVIESFGEPVLDELYPYKYAIGSSKYQKAVDRHLKSVEDSKLPKEPTGNNGLYYRLVKEPFYHNKKDGGTTVTNAVDSTISIWGDLRYLTMEDPKTYASMRNIIDQLEACGFLCEVTLSVFDELPGKTYIFSKSGYTGNVKEAILTEKDTHKTTPIAVEDINKDVLLAILSSEKDYRIDNGSGACVLKDVYNIENCDKNCAKCTGWQLHKTEELRKYFSGEKE